MEVLRIDDLGYLASVANAKHEAGEKSSLAGLGHFREAGEALLRAKGLCGHGKWLAWVDKRLAFSERRAERYMALAKSDAASDLEAQWRIISGHAHVSANTGQIEWYTPDEYLEAARLVLGEIELDPASSKIANQRVKAKRFYTAADDGLAQEWHGKVWLNPPYTNELIVKFVSKLCGHVKAGDVEAILLVNNATETAWFQEAAQESDMICFPSGRVRFVDEEGNPGAPLQGQAVLYFGKQLDLFAINFETFGFCKI